MAMGDDDFDTEALEADLSAALDGEPPPEESQVQETPEQKEERLYRREGRRFAAIEKAAEKDKEGAAGAEQQPAPVAQGPKPPLWFKPDHGVEWDKLPEPFRKALEQREKDFAQGIEKHATPAKAWGAVEQHFAPFKEHLERAGSSVQQEVEGLIGTYKTLATGSDVERVQTLERLVATFFGGRSIEQLAYELQQAGYQPAPQPDPYVRQLEQKLARLEQGLTGIQSSAQERERAQLQAEIASFAKDKPDFDMLRPMIAGLMRANPEATLAEAYEQARWAHPEARKRSLEAQRKAEVERARAGAQSPRGAPSPNGAARSKPTMSLEEEIAMHLDGG